jgi:hypothetical protein
MGEINWELIVHRLDEIVKSQTEIKPRLDEIDKKLMRIETLNEKVDEIKEWKEVMLGIMSPKDLEDMREWKKRVDELVTPTQLRQMLKEFEALKTFKTQALMIWVVVQAITVIIAMWEKLF